MNKITPEDILKMPADIDMDALIAVKIIGIDVKHNWHWKHTTKNYSNDMNAAWEVVEEMCKRHFRFEIGGNFMGLGKKYAAFDNEQWADKNPLFKAFAETVPLAICRAALLATMDSE